MNGHTWTFRSFSVLTAVALFVSTTADGWRAAVEAIAAAAGQRTRSIPVYTDRPRPAWTGRNPGRAAATRGGQYPLRVRGDLLRYFARGGGGGGDLLAFAGNPALLSAEFLQNPDPPEGSGGGAPLPGEGLIPMGGGSVNTANGNKATVVPLVGWNARGAVDMGLTLYHNSLATNLGVFGRAWSHSYDIHLLPEDASAIVKWGDGRITQFTLVENSDPPEYIAPPGEFSTLEYLSSTTYRITLPSKVILNLSIPNGHDLALLDSIVDRNGNTTTITRDGNHRITAITDPNSRSITFDYVSGQDLVEIVTDPLGREWTFTYLDSHLTKILYPEVTDVNNQTSTPERTFEYAQGGYDITKETDTRGKAWTFVYAIDGLTSNGMLQSAEDPLLNETTFDYQTDKTKIEDPADYQIVHHYSDGLLCGVDDEANFGDRREYNADRLIETYTDRREFKWSFTWNSEGRLLTLTNPLDNTWTLTYNAQGDLESIQDPVNPPTEIEYYSGTAGRIHKIVDPLGRDTVTYTYGAYGLIATIEDALGRTTTLTRNAKGEITEIQRPGENAYAIEYDDISRPIQIADPYQEVTELIYDQLGRMKKAILPDLEEIKAKFDHEGNVTDLWDELGRHTQMAYDERGLLETVENARGDIETYTYDDRGLLTQRENGRGKVYQYSYSPRGEVIELGYPSGATEEWSYGSNGDVTARYLGIPGHIIGYAYDDAGRLTGIDYPTGTDTAFAYDPADRLVEMIDASGTTEWEYNDADELTQLTTPQGVVNYVYKLDGQLEKIQQPSMNDLVYRYDDYGRVDRITSAFNEVTDIIYDNLGSRVERKNLPNGTHELYAYDVRGRVEAITLKKNNDVLRALEYTYNEVDNIEQIVETRASTITKTYDYDAIDQLIEETWSTGYSAEYEYDENGNRTRRTIGTTVEDYFYGDDDELTGIKIGSTVVKSFGYDGAGRRTSATYGGVTTSYAYDYESRITSITRTGTTTNSFAYNGFDTRVSKTDSSGTTAYKRAGAYVTDSLLKSTVSSTTTDYTPGVSSYDGATNRFLHSGIKNADEQTGNSGAIAASRQYDAFGNIVSSNQTWQGPFGYGGPYGYQTDPDHGLMLLGHRYYEADTGRFLTRDPIKDGRNWYGYCDGNPTSRADPGGLDYFIVIWTGVFGTGTHAGIAVDWPGSPNPKFTDFWPAVPPRLGDMTSGKVRGPGVISPLKQFDLKTQETFAKDDELPTFVIRVKSSPQTDRSIREAMLLLTKPGDTFVDSLAEFDGLRRNCVHFVSLLLMWANELDEPLMTPADLHLWARYEKRGSLIPRAERATQDLTSR